jgi:hypothetical protein
MKNFRLVSLIVVIASFCRAQALCCAEPGSVTFRVSYTAGVSKEPFSGRVFLILSPARLAEPPKGPNWFNPAPFFAQDVKSWQPGTDLVFRDGCMSYPCSLSQLKKGSYWAMAMMDFDRGGTSFGASEGNGFSKAVPLELDPSERKSYGLSIDQIFHERPLHQTGRVKIVEVQSKLLTAFFGTPTFMKAAVILPTSFADNPNRHYPVIYEIPGFGGTHATAFSAAARNPTNVAGTEMLYVVLDPSCRYGHHVFADSDNNGPRGKNSFQQLKRIFVASALLRPATCGAIRLAAGAVCGSRLPIRTSLEASGPLLRTLWIFAIFNALTSTSAA